jgi:hypothetical protein
MVQARNNSFGSYEFYKDVFIRNDQWYHNGEHYWQYGTTRLYPHYCERSGQSSNPLRPLIEGGLPVWRDPSSYYRHIWDEQCEPFILKLASTNQWNETTTHQWESYPHRPLGSSYWTESRYSLGGGGPSWPSDLESRAIAKGISDVKNGVAELGEDIAQMRSTYGMLSGAISTLGAGLRAVRNRDISGAIRIIKDPRGVVKRGSNLWLQYQYGWKPLVTTVYDLATELWGEYPRVPVLHYKKGFHRTTTNLLNYSGYDSKGLVEINGRLSWSYRLTNGYIGTTMDKIGLSNPLSLGWALIPYSFVVDWMLPIGPILDSFTPPQGTEFIGGSAVASWKGSLQYKPIVTPPYVAISPGLVKLRCRSMERRVYDDWPVAGLYVKSPFSLSHGITSVALFLQNLLK